MIKKEKGITLISLSIAVIIILAITGMILYSAKDSIYIKNLTNMQNDIENLREKVSEYYAEYGDIPAQTEYEHISNLESAGVIGANDTGKFYILELEKLDGLTLNYGEDYETYKANGYTYSSDLTDIYVINKTSHNIFYIEGIRVSENGETKMYYTDYTEGDTEEVVLIGIEDWHEETNDDGETIITNGITELKIGDYIAYDPTDGATITSYTSTEEQNGYGDQVFNLSSYTYGWRVLGLDEDTNEILLVSEDYIGPDSGGYEGYGRTYYYLIGQTGYANGIKELDAISELYGQGEGATGARSIKVEDVDKIVGYEQTDIENWGSGQTQAYGNEITYTSAGFTYFDEGSKTWKTLEDGESVTLKNNYYYYTNNNELLFVNSENSAIEDSYKKGTSGCLYWLASSFLVTYDESNVHWGIHRVMSGSLNIGHANDSSMIYGSSSSGRDRYGGIRPVVSLESDISISGGSGASDDPYTIQ